MDIECYKDYFLVMFMNAETGGVGYFEMYPGFDLDIEALDKVLHAAEIVTFNGNSYDIPMVAAAVFGGGNQSLKNISDSIIGGLPPWQVYKQKMIPQLSIKHIDLIEVAPGMASLKIYGGRLHTKKMQDLPIEPDASISPEQREQLKLYCKNDLEVTRGLLNQLTQQLELRATMSETYGMDLMSKSDAQIAEAVIVSEVEKRIGMKIQKPRVAAHQFNYVAPEFIKFRTDQLNDALRIATEFPFQVKANGTIDMPKELATLKIQIGDSIYQMGMGGLHSTEKSVSHYAE
jgi:hypothetical protein